MRAARVHDPTSPRPRRRATCTTGTCDAFHWHRRDLHLGIDYLRHCPQSNHGAYLNRVFHRRASADFCNPVANPACHRLGHHRHLVGGTYPRHCLGLRRACRDTPVPQPWIVIDTDRGGLAGDGLFGQPWRIGGLGVGGGGIAQSSQLICNCWRAQLRFCRGRVRAQYELWRRRCRWRDCLRPGLALTGHSVAGEMIRVPIVPEGARRIDAACGLAIFRRAASERRCFFGARCNVWA